MEDAVRHNVVGFGHELCLGNCFTAMFIKESARMPSTH